VHAFQIIFNLLLDLIVPSLSALEDLERDAEEEKK
jgi:hypothetical protein